MRNSSSSSKVEGNNISSTIVKKLQINPAIGWCFTFNNYNNNNSSNSSIVPEFQELLKKNCKLAFYNKEVGESGTPHLQGYLELLKKGRPINMFPKGIHWAKAKGNLDKNFKYCSKECDDIHDMSFIHGYKLKPKIKIIKELRPFQAEIEKLLLGPVDEGKIIWIYDIIGQLGKTQLVRYLNVKYGMPFTYGGKAADIINLVFNHKEYLLSTDKGVMIYNFGRDTDNQRISYKSMEQISDGCISNTKFETGCFVCNCPHVLVMANCLPNVDALTKSRWIIKTINKDTLKLEDYKLEI